jgi:hypothetical protein
VKNQNMAVGEGCEMAAGMEQPDARREGLEGTTTTWQGHRAETSGVTAIERENVVGDWVLMADWGVGC